MAQYSGTALQTPPVKCSDNVSPAEEVPESLPVSVTLSTTTPVAVGLPPTARPRERAESGGRSDGSQRYKKIKSTKVLEPGTRAYRSLRSNTCENLSAIPAEYTTPKSRYAKLEAEPDFNPEPVEPAVVVQPIIQIDSPGTEEEEEVEETKTCQVTAAPEQPPSPPPQLLSRGEPDGGCGLDPSLQLPTSPTPTKFGDSLPTKLEASTHSIPTIPVPSPHELLNCKKGWLMKQGPGGEWQKHWFVLQVHNRLLNSCSGNLAFKDFSGLSQKVRNMNICCLLQGSALMYFSGSDESDLDGIIDLGLVQKVSRAVCVIIISFLIVISVSCQITTTQACRQKYRLMLSNVEAKAGSKATKLHRVCSVRTQNAHMTILTGIDSKQSQWPQHVLLHHH